MTGHRRPSDDELRALLRDAAAAHQPDRTAMLNRIAQHRTPGRPRRRQLLRVAGSTLVVASVLGIGGVARWTLSDEDHPVVTAPVVTTSVATSAAPSTAPAPHPAPTTVTTTTKAPPRSSAPPSASKSDPGSAGPTRAEQGPLSAAGSIDADSTDTLALSDVTIKVRAPITALDVTVRVALTPGLLDQGALHDVKTAQIDSTVLHEPDALVYHFKLHQGDTLATGTYVFTAKYAHRKGDRDLGDDGYRVQATTAAGKLDVDGDFRRTN